MAPSHPQVITQRHCDADSKLDVLIVGAGLGGLGAAISILLAGHTVHILESASEISEIGAGIQCLPNATRVLISWGLQTKLEKIAMKPKKVNVRGWKGELISNMDFDDYEEECGSPFWDFHRAELHAVLLRRAEELGARLSTGKRVVDVQCSSHGEEASVAVAVCADGTRYGAHLVVGADGVHSQCRELLLGRKDPPLLTGDLAYRLLLDTAPMREDPELKCFIDDPQVNYWMGPDAHAVTYLLRAGTLLNMVLLVPDDMPAGATTLAGNVREMRALYRAWDPLIPKLLSLCTQVSKWRLTMRPQPEPSWSHPSASFTLLGDAAHATLPYLASGAGMSIEDGHVLGLCLSAVTSRRTAEKEKALAVYERCRRERTARVVERGNLQQFLYHLHDGPEREERDALLRAFGGLEGEGRGRESRLNEVGGEEGMDPLAWRWGGVGGWLLTYHCEEDVERRRREVEAEAEAEEKRGGERLAREGEMGVKAVL
ncbi:hypothetical protein G6514_002680 [Epicoccum nigrum]|nr:hypothetical protein G6514_002680 [Epicoccum nigrum]